MRVATVVILTICYSAIWAALLFIVVGFFIPNPVSFNRKLRGVVVPYKNDDRYIKEALYYDMIDDD